MSQRHLSPDRLKSPAARRFLATGIQPRRQAEKLVQEFDRKVRDSEAPNDIRIMLHPRRYARMAPDIPEIRSELLAYFDERCREAGWETVGERRLHFSTDATVAIDGERVIVQFRHDPVDRPASQPKTLIPEQPVAPPAAHTTDRPAEGPAGEHPLPGAPPPAPETVTTGKRRTGTIPTVVLCLSGGERIPVTYLPFRIGRAVDNDLVLASFAVSRHHAELVETDDGITLRDLDSRNGIVVDGERCEAVPAEHGIRAHLGDIELRVERPTRNGQH